MNNESAGPTASNELINSTTEAVVSAYVLLIFAVISIVFCVIYYYEKILIHKYRMRLTRLFRRINL